MIKQFIKNLVYFIFTWIPASEVFSRRAYYFIKDHKGTAETSTKTTKIKKNEVVRNNAAIIHLREYIDGLGIKNGDTVIVHVGMEELGKLGVNPIEVMTYLISLIGDDGTLVMTAFPSNFKDNIYDVKKNAISTGIVPALLCRQKGAVRSLYPYNSLVAYGKYSEDLMKENLKAQTPHGKYSAWMNCVKRHAKILHIGMLVYNRMTVGHVAEDLLFEEGKLKVKNWYEEKNIKIKDYDGKLFNYNYKTRNNFYSRFLTEYYFAKKYRDKKLVVEKKIEGVYIGFTNDSYELVKYIMDMADKGKYPYRIPRKYIIR